MKWVDVTVPVSEGLAVWPGDVPVKIIPSARLARGDEYNISAITLCLHAGTHIDAPWHASSKGARISELDINLFMGNCLLMDLSNQPHRVGKEFFTDKIPDGTDRLILKMMGDSEYSDEPRLMSRYLQEGAVAHLLEKGIRLLGCDVYSVGGAGSECSSVHRMALGGGCILLERLDLRGIQEGKYEMICMPLKTGLDGAPARVLIGTEE